MRPTAYQITLAPHYFIDQLSLVMPRSEATFKVRSLVTLHEASVANDALLRRTRAAAYPEPVVPKKLADSYYERRRKISWSKDRQVRKKQLNFIHTSRASINIKITRLLASLPPFEWSESQLAAEPDVDFKKKVRSEPSMRRWSKRLT